MPTTPPLETFTAGHESTVDVAEIERQLGALWAAAADSGKDASARAVTRACMFNLVAVCATDEAREHLTETIRILTSRHPCRAILLRAASADAAGDSLSASITAHCHLAAGGGKQVCCEQISLSASGARVGALPGAVLPLLESDLPTVLWWSGAFLDQPELFRRLSDGIDRLFFDTSHWNVRHDLRGRLTALTESIDQLPRVLVCDLSWTRLHLWRQLIADLFESPGCAESLSHLERVRIRHGRGPGAWLRSRLLGAWLAAQLRWDPADARERLELQCVDEDDVEGAGLLEVKLEGPEARFEVCKHHGEQAATSVVHMPRACELPRKRAFWPTDDASLLSQELDRPSRREVYWRTLRMAVQVW